MEARTFQWEGEVYILARHAPTRFSLNVAGMKGSWKVLRFAGLQMIVVPDNRGLLGSMAKDVSVVR